MTEVIKPEALNLDKSWSSIPNQSNIKGWNWETKFNYTKGLKKIAIKRMRIKIQNKFYIWLKGEIEKKY